MSSSPPPVGTPLRAEPPDLPQLGLGTVDPLRRLYSPTAGVFISFFGGVYAALAFWCLNARRLGSRPVDLALTLGLAAAWSGLLLCLGAAIAQGALGEWLS